LELTKPEKYAAYNRSSINKASQWKSIPTELQEAIRVVSLVLPFKVNQYVLDHLIDWDRIPDDPIYRLTFPHEDMLEPEEYRVLRELVHRERTDAELQSAVQRIRGRMNPHPAGQLTHNVPLLEGRPLPGVQHKYKETVLLFPGAGQTCHAYCTFCFRWPQFIGEPDLKFDARSSEDLIEYLKRHREVSDVLITGGDPMIMNAASLEHYIRPLLSDELAHVRNIRIGTKAVSYWPQRFVCDKDSGDVLRLFEQVVKSGRNLALMAHYNHPRELGADMSRRAVRNILATGATIRVQSPLVRHINDRAQDWVDLWTLSVNLGAIPYYMFVERDTGPSAYFHLPLDKAYRIFADAYKRVSGLGRTVRGPSMSALNGKVTIDGIVEVAGEKAFALQYLQARQADWVRQPFLAKFDPHATWFDQLEPFSEQDAKFFEKGAAAKSFMLQVV